MNAQAASVLMHRDETISFAGTLVDILVAGEDSKGEFSLLRITNPPGVWTPLHRHLHEEESIYVLAGQIAVETRGETFLLSAGEIAILPRGEAHRLGNAGPQDAQALVFCTPAGFERFVREAGQATATISETVQAPDSEALARLASLSSRFGIELLPTT